MLNDCVEKINLDLDHELAKSPASTLLFLQICFPLTTTTQSSYLKNLSCHGEFCIRGNLRYDLRYKWIYPVDDAVALQANQVHMWLHIWIESCFALRQIHFLKQRFKLRKIRKLPD